MLELNPAIVCRIIDQAKEFQAQEGVVIPATDGGSEIDSDQAMQTLAAHTDDLTYQQLKAEIDDLEPRQQVELVALMWLGRGDYEADEWEDVRDQAKDQWSPHTAEYLLATPQVPDFLEEGLSMLGYSCGED
ncbi:MAG TPA: DUF3775 domain-containing protein [Gammaproteobacteria bacterium]